MAEIEIGNKKIELDGDGFMVDPTQWNDELAAAIAKADGIEGKVYVRFIVRDNGDIANVEVERGIGGGCDEEALRVVKSMPKWIPATSEGKLVNVQYVIPINFKLQ